ncbi:uncharacterized protein LOC132631225 [Lycium barbarum]|uniref:uncharacterized protein LOC132631225 n=1 Tax=Lycium barbarum TaxID=112863 RepID=UPI00293F6017|nr:uncharacterized protein LOC132631225 [Lycium barbarum]
MANPEFILGMTFINATEFRAALRAYSVKNNRNIFFKKNESGKISAKCSDGCPWRIYASRKAPDDPTIEIKTLVGKHSDDCLFVYANKHVKSRMIAKTYLHYLRKHPDESVGDFMEKIHEEMNVEISVSQVYRVKRIAKEMIEGHYKEQYAKLEDYCAELKKKNPGSTVLLETIPNEEDGKPIFERIYICLEPCKRSWKAGCRPLIGMDGCFLKGPYGGQLLTAIGIDVDNGMFPIAYAVVDVEDKHNWKWFLNLLVDDLQIRNHDNLCLITDKQKGLEGAIYEIVPQVEHRHCVRHLYNNFKKVHKGLSLETRVWKAAKATYVSKYRYEMDTLEQEDKEARNWFNDKPPKFWSKSHFKTTTKCDILLNNLCESFNGIKPILKAREKPILGLLEGIRVYLMKRMNQKREVLQYQGSLCPRIQKLVEEKKKAASASIPTWAGQFLFQVKTMYGEQFSVDLNGRTCSCREWDLIGIPCAHAISCIFSIRENPENFINDCYKKATQMRIYEPVIAPMDGPDMWETTDLLPVQPPTYEPKKGKLNKNRRKEPDEIEASKRKAVEMKKQRREKKRKQSASNDLNAAATNVTKLSKKGRLGRCSKCLQTGHNKTTCKKNSDSLNSIAPPQAIPTTRVWPAEDGSSQMPAQAQVGSIVINAEKYKWNGKNCISLQSLQNTSVSMKSNNKSFDKEENRSN